MLDLYGSQCQSISFADNENAIFGNGITELFISYGIIISRRCTASRPPHSVLSSTHQLEPYPIIGTLVREVLVRALVLRPALSVLVILLCLALLLHLLVFHF